MTVAVVARTPWGTPGHIFRSLPGNTHGSLIFASDSRWTFPGTPNCPPEDIAQKLWPITNDLGAVFAGDVRAAEEGLERLEQAIKRERPIGKPGDLATLARDQFSMVLQAHQAQRKVTPSAVYYLLGTCYPNGQTDCIYLSSTIDFAPIFVQGVYAIGWPSACESFKTHLAVNTESHLSQGQLTDDPTIWGMHLASALNAVIEDPNEESVGGGVQWAILDQAGWRTMTLDLSVDGQNWSTMTRDQAELQRYKRRFHLPSLSTGAPDLGLFHISD